MPDTSLSSPVLFLSICPPPLPASQFNKSDLPQVHQLVFAVVRVEYFVRFSISCTIYNPIYWSALLSSPLLSVICFLPAVSPSLPCVTILPLWLYLLPSVPFNLLPSIPCIYITSSALSVKHVENHPTRIQGRAYYSKYQLQCPGRTILIAPGVPWSANQVPTTKTGRFEIGMQQEAIEDLWQ